MDVSTLNRSVATQKTKQCHNNSLKGKYIDKHDSVLPHLKQPTRESFTSLRLLCRLWENSDIHLEI